MDRPIFAQRLKNAREKKNYSQVQVFEHTGINNKTLSGYEKGKSQPDFDSLTKLCTLYEVSVDWILGHTNNPRSQLTEGQRKAAEAVNMDDDSFLDLPFTINGRELTRDEKIKLRSVAQLVLEKGR